MQKPRQFSAQDRSDFDQLKGFIQLRLQQIRGVSELIWDVGNAMFQIDRRGLWWMDMNDPAGPFKKKVRRRKPTREQWADRILKISDRQARKYFKVGELLTRAEVEGTGLCLDRMEQLALTPQALRPQILRLAATGVSVESMRKAREAGADLLKTKIDYSQHPELAPQTETEQQQMDTDAAKHAGKFAYTVGQQCELGRDAGRRPCYTDKMLAAAAKQPGLALACAYLRLAEEELWAWEVEDMTLEHVDELADLHGQIGDRLDDLRPEVEAHEEEKEEQEALGCAG